MNVNYLISKSGLFCKRHPLLSIVISVIILLWFVMPDFDFPKSTTATTKTSEDLENERLNNSYKEKCLTYKAAKQSCAVAGNIAQCIEIKIGKNEAFMAGSNCVMAGIAID